MRENNQVKMTNYTNFKTYQTEYNREFLLSVLLISFFVEVLYFIVGGLAIAVYEIGTKGWVLSSYVGLISTLVLGTYVLLFFVIKYYFRALPTTVGLLTMAFLFFHKISLALANPNSVTLPVIWLILMFIFARYYLKPNPFMICALGSCALFTINIAKQPEVLGNLRPVAWVMIISALNAGVISRRHFLHEMEAFDQHHKAMADTEAKLDHLNKDMLTGLKTKYAFDQYIQEKLDSKRNDHTYVIIVDLDDMVLCNRLYGYETGNRYIQSMGWLLHYLECDTTDIVSRHNGDVFVGILGSYKNSDLIKKRLEQYNHILKDDFVLENQDNRFVPHYSFGVAHLEEGMSYLDAHARAENAMYDQKSQNKKHLANSNYYLPHVNLATLFNESSITVIVWKVAAGWPVGFVTANIKELLGYTNEEIMADGFYFHDLIHPEDVDRIEAEVEGYMAAHVDNYEQTYRVRNAYGTYIWVRDYSVPVWSEGKIIQVNGYIHDITQAKASESMFQHTEKLNALGRLSGGIAHDMNNHLMIIGSQLDLALEKDALEVYRDSCKRMGTVVAGASNVVKQLMTFGSHNLYEPKAYNLVNIAKGILGMLEHTFEKNIVITASYYAKEVFVKVDRSLVENALLNLCINAKDAMDYGGLLQLQVDTLDTAQPMQTLTGMLRPGQYGLIRVKDDGVGIPEEAIEKIFEPFYTSKMEGNGIGLSAVIGVIRQHNGAINVQSTVGKGTTFTLYFPLVAPVEQPPEKKAATRGLAEADETLNILIIDDEPILSETLKEFLNIKGQSAVAFDSAIEGLKYYEDHHHRIHLVLLDMLMPEMNGEEVFRAMHNINSDVKVIYLSGYSEGIEVGEEDQDNILAFFSKPLSMPELYNRIVEEMTIDG